MTSAPNTASALAMRPSPQPISITRSFADRGQQRIEMRFCTEIANECFGHFSSARRKTLGFSDAADSGPANGARLASIAWGKRWTVWEPLLNSWTGAAHRARPAKVYAGAFRPPAVAVVS